MKNHKKRENGLLNGVFMAYFILLLHVVLLAALGCIVLFFRGIIQYMFWIFLGGATLLTYSGYQVYRRMKYEKKTLQEMLALPEFAGRSVEVSLLGGFASVRVGAPSENHLLEAGPAPDVPALPHYGNSGDSAAVHVRELTELAHLLENNLITRDEFNRTKDQLLNGETINL